MAKQKLTITINPDIYKKLTKWRDKTGIPITILIEQGTRLRFDELEKLFRPYEETKRKLD